MDFNYHCLHLILDCLQLDLPYNKTEEYYQDPDNLKDARYLVAAKNKQPQQLEPYLQVFQDKFGFLNDLSIVDLIFNEGPNSLNYLQRQEFLIP